MKLNNCAIIICPPYPEFKEQPADQSHCELFDCPKCKGKMWLSDKKKGILMFASCLEKDILLACYDCITKMVKENPDGFPETVTVNL